MDTIDGATISTYRDANVKWLDRGAAANKLRAALANAGLSSHRLHPEAILEVWQVFGGDPDYIEKFSQWLVNDTRIHSRRIVDTDWINERLNDLLNSDAPPSDSASYELFKTMTIDMVNGRLGAREDRSYKLVRTVITASRHPRMGEAKYVDLAGEAPEVIGRLFFRFKRDGEEYVRLRIQWWRFTELPPALK